jgi:hypothetical protein
MDGKDEPVTNAALQNAVKEIREEIAQFAASVNTRIDGVTETVRDIETNLLTEVHRYAKGTSHRLHTFEVTEGDVKERLHQIEERLLELERRIRPQ